MANLFQQHYTRDEVRALLPQVRGWLQRLSELRGDISKLDKKLEKLMEPGRDLGGPVVENWVRTVAQIKTVLFEFVRREIQIKDLKRGLLDFPALMGDKEVFLCWEHGEADVDFWHELDAGYAGRQRLDDLDL